MEISPFRALRYDRTQVEGGAAVATAPPYDVISPVEHEALVRRSPWNITALTLGVPGSSTPGYEDRAAKLEEWIAGGVLQEDAEPGFYAYTIDYVLPLCGAETRHRFLGLLALGKLHAFEDGVVLPHEQTFPKVVDDRRRLLEAPRTHLASIFLLYSDREQRVDAILQECSSGEADIEVEAKPGEYHALHRMSDPTAIAELRELFLSQRPIIADGHHRYTMGLGYRDGAGSGVPGSNWQLMTFANLFSDGLSILATHRLVKLEGILGGEALERILLHLDEVSGDDWDMRIESSKGSVAVRFPEAVKNARSGVSRTSYALLQDVVLGEWLKGHVREGGVTYFKESTGENEALQRGDGDLLFRMPPVGRDEFQSVVEGRETFPHKTTYFYPKLWSGLACWRLADVE